jgi:hypothetical protein
MAFAYELTNRETATFIWIALFLLYMSRHRSVRESLVSVVCSALKLKLVALACFAWLWIALGVCFLLKLGIWEVIHLKDTVIWALFSGTLIAFRGISSNDPIGEFRAHLSELFRVTALIVFYANWQSLPLVWELLFVPVTAFLAALSAVAATEEKFRPVEILLQWIIGLLGLGMMIYVTALVLRNPDGFLSGSTLVSCLLPFILAIWAVPFGYVSSVISGYEQILLRLRNAPADLRFYSVLKIAELGNLHATRIRRISSLMAGRAAWEQSQDGLDSFFGELQKTLRDPDNREPRDFIWPKPKLLPGELQYSSLDEYLSAVDPLLDDLIRLWISTIEEFSQTNDEGEVPVALANFLSDNWPEMERIHGLINDLKAAPEEALCFDRELHSFCYDLEHVFSFYSPQDTSIIEPSHRGFMVFSGYRSAQKQFERLALRAKKLAHQNPGRDGSL